MMRETWKKTQYKHYEVSNFGRVRSLHRRNKNNIIAQQTSNSGYKQAWVCENGKEYNKLVHRLVAKAFIPNPLQKPEVNHKDLDKTNNCVENLEWVTASENNIHALENGKYVPSGEQHWNSILNWHLVRDMRQMYDSGMKISDISSITGIHRRTISDVVNFETWVKDEDIL